MGMFNIREPRRFEHKYIYVDERKERLQKMEENAKRKLGLIPEEPYNPENIRGKFVEGTRHLKKRKENGESGLPIEKTVIIIAALLFVLHWIVTGEWFF